MVYLVNNKLRIIKIFLYCWSPYIRLNVCKCTSTHLIGINVDDWEFMFIAMVSTLFMYQVWSNEQGVSLIYRVLI